ncbi:hypothetical protein BVX94_01965 [bacterium B17]|nr:hypothetical protein BVX94_01965 [bacterium B17]
MSVSTKLQNKLDDLPNKPGCYMMRDRRGKIIYVGKAVSLRKRVQSYFRQSTRRRGDPKLRSLVKSIHDLDYIVVRNEAEAILTEGKLIKEYKPYYNVLFKDDKRFLLVRTEPSHPFPMFKTCRIKRDDGAMYFGPYVSSPAAKATVDFIEKTFGIRKCQPRVPDENTYKHCINDIVRFCSAPCIGKVSSEEYLERFEEACAFLRGERMKYLVDLREKMEEASKKMKFEEAASLRDILLKLQETIKKRARVAPTAAMKREDAAKAVRELRDVLGLKKIPRVVEGYDISNISGTHSVGSMVCFVDGMSRRNRYRRFRIKTVEGSDDPGMMAEVIKRRFGRMKKEGGEPPDLVIVDGGITQVHAARGELDKLGLSTIPVAGLAKRYEEIYWEDGKPTILLDKRANALKMLQRLRDEAHRFALTYHRHLRGKRIRESVLDDIPGIGMERKRMILEHFGSVRKLEKASVEDIMQVKGIGSEMAKLIFSSLKSN